MFGLHYWRMGIEDEGIQCTYVPCRESTDYIRANHDQGSENRREWPDTELGI